MIIKHFTLVVLRMNEDEEKVLSRFGIVIQWVEIRGECTKGEFQIQSNSDKR